MALVPENLVETSMTTSTMNQSSEAYDQGSNFKIVDAEFIKTDLNLWRETLADGYPIALRSIL